MGKFMGVTLHGCWLTVQWVEMAATYTFTVNRDLPGSRGTCKKVSTLCTGQCTKSNQLGAHHLKAYKACILGALAIRITFWTAMTQSLSWPPFWGAKPTALCSSEKLSLPRDNFPTTGESSSGNQCLAGHSRAFISCTTCGCKQHSPVQCIASAAYLLSIAHPINDNSTFYWPGTCFKGWLVLWGRPARSKLQ